MYRHRFDNFHSNSPTRYLVLNTILRINKQFAATQKKRSLWVCAPKGWVWVMKVYVCRNVLNNQSSRPPKIRTNKKLFRFLVHAVKSLAFWKKWLFHLSRRWQLRPILPSAWWHFKQQSTTTKPIQNFNITINSNSTSRLGIILAVEVVEITNADGNLKIAQNVLFYRTSRRWHPKNSKNQQSTQFNRFIQHTQQWCATWCNF